MAGIFGGPKMPDAPAPPPPPPTTDDARQAEEDLMNLRRRRGRASTFLVNTAAGAAARGRSASGALLGQATAPAAPGGSDYTPAQRYGFKAEL